MKQKVPQPVALSESNTLTTDQMKKIKGGMSYTPCSALTCSATKHCPTNCPPCYLNIGACGL